MFDVDKKSVIITGSAQGFGKEFALRLLQAGARVCLSDVDEKTGLSTLQELQKTFGKDKVIFVRCDVAKEEDWQSLWTEAERSLGYISVLINNAGINKDCPWRKCLDIMLIAVGIGSSLAVEKMGKSKGGSGGRIINIASMAGLSLFESQLQHFGYFVAKSGVVAWTRSFAYARPDPVEHEGIKCFALCPFFADTQLLRRDFSDLGQITRRYVSRVLTVQDVGRALVDSIELDSNGACLLVYPDAPLVDMPNANVPMLGAYMVVGKVLHACGLHPAYLSWVAVAGMAVVLVVFLLMAVYLLACAIL